MRALPCDQHTFGRHAERERHRPADL